MALNEMKFLGNNRYFKYRFANETEIKYLILEDTCNVNQFEIMADYLKRSLNIRLKWGDFIASDFTELCTAPNNFNDTHIFTVDTARSFFDGRLEYFTPSYPYGTLNTIILSAAPKRVTSTSLSFLNMDTPVVILIVSTMVILSLLLVVHSIVTNKYKSLRTKKVVKKMARETLGNVWDNASLFCTEPIPSVLPHITCRLLTASWLIGVTFILFFLGCFLRTEFTTESYNGIDTLSDLIKSGIPPAMNSETFQNLRLLATQEPVVKEWLGALDRKKITKDLSESIYWDFHPIFYGKNAVITRIEYLRIWLLILMFSNPSASRIEFIMNKGGFYFSQQDVAVDYVHTMFNTSWVRRSPQLHESLQLSMAPFFETQVFKYLDFKRQYKIERLKWKRPLKTVAGLDLSSVGVPFYFLLMLLSGTVAVVIIEIILNFLS